MLDRPSDDQVAVDDAAQKAAGWKFARMRSDCARSRLGCAVSTISSPLIEFATTVVM
jgi:hypothetical protein